MTVYKHLSLQVTTMLDAIKEKCQFLKNCEIVLWRRKQNNTIIINIIIIIVIISFMQCIYTYIPETNYVPREYSVAANLLLFMVFISLVSVLNLLYFYIIIFRSMCAVPNMAVFCSSSTSCLPGMFLTYFLNDFEIVPVASIITGITFVFTLHMRYISIVGLYILESSRLPFKSRFCFLRLQRLLTYTFPFHYHEL